MTDWPAWATERVDVVPPDPGWADRGERESRLLQADLRPWLAGPVEHVGSTAVPGLAAKPILDFQAAVADLACAPDIATALSPAGWQFVPPELDDRPWRRFFVQVLQGHRVAHLHVMVTDNPRWREQLAFRDALRAGPVLAAAYGTLKKSLAARHADDREVYTAAKTEYVRFVLLGGEGSVPSSADAARRSRGVRARNRRR